MNKKINLWLPILLIGFAVILRVLPHPPNFAPVAAIALFGAAILPKKWALVLPLFIMILSDAIIGFHGLILVTWGCYLVIALASRMWLRKGSLGVGVALTISSSMFFFVVTNFAVWFQGSLYPRTFAGLERCFTLALPFFRNTFLSDIIYTTALFGVYALATRTVSKTSKLHLSS